MSLTNYIIYIIIYNKSVLNGTFFTNIKKKPHVIQRTLAFLRTEDPVRVNDQAKQCGILSSCLLKPQIWNAMEVENMNVFTTLQWSVQEMLLRLNGLFVNS